MVSAKRGSPAERYSSASRYPAAFSPGMRRIFKMPISLVKELPEARQTTGLWLNSPLVWPSSRRTFLAGAGIAAAGWMAGKIAQHASAATTQASEPLENSPDRRTDAEFLQHQIKQINDDD